MSKATITALISELEDAIIGSPELDARVCESVGYEVRYHKGGPTPYYQPDKEYSWLKVPAYTTSLDAAFTLIKGRLSMLCQAHMPDMGGKQWHASIHDAGNHSARARTAALAICIAALKVIAAQS